MSQLVTKRLAPVKLQLQLHSRQAGRQHTTPPSLEAPVSDKGHRRGVLRSLVYFVVSFFVVTIFLTFFVTLFDLFHPCVAARVSGPCKVRNWVHFSVQSPPGTPHFPIQGLERTRDPTPLGMELAGPQQGIFVTSDNAGQDGSEVSRQNEPIIQTTAPVASYGPDPAPSWSNPEVTTALVDTREDDPAAPRTPRVGMEGVPAPSRHGARRRRAGGVLPRSRHSKTTY